MHQNGLLTALKCGNDAHVSAVLASVDSSTWPCETLLPFVLRKTLRNLPEDMELGYVEQCLRLFSVSRRLQDLQKEEAAELHRMSLLTESLYAMSKYRYGNNVSRLSDLVMRKYQMMVRLYGCRRYSAQFRYLVTVCHRRTRLLFFQKRAQALLSKLLRKLQTLCLRFVDQLISVMIA
ncbi:unnamed protein product [Heligmosomoides polygyrus]|uniref:ANK_REP_REGION domain-containing protein n=1 Tax=Heligmosomoides polygyrus TaxID=6339 RepID=A0A183G5K7_HELPZ|nr:unnamed protein product [Heligmosomoides polygyrus]